MKSNKWRGPCLHYPEPELNKTEFKFSKITNQDLILYDYNTYHVNSTTFFEDFRKLHTILLEFIFTNFLKGQYLILNETNLKNLDNALSLRKSVV